MSMATPSWGGRLRELRQQAVEAGDVRALRSVARKALQDLPRHVQDLESARERVIAALDKQLETLKPRRPTHRPQESALSSSSSASASDRRSSISSAAREPLPAAKAGAAAPARRAAAAVTCQRSPALPYAVVLASPPGSIQPPRSNLSPRMPSATQPQAQPAAGNASPTERTATPQPGAAQQQPAAPTADPSNLLMETRLLALEEQVGTLTAELEAARHAHAQLKRQVQITHAAGLSNGTVLAAVEEQVQKLSAAQQEQAATRDKVTLLQSKQEQLRQRQQLDACACDIVLKCPKPLPADGTAAHVQQLLSRQLQLALTVVRVQHLRSGSSGGSGSSDGSSSSGGSNSSAQRRHAYRVSLGSRGERAAVLRTKAQRLRGTDLSIDALLTPDQLASKHQLQPVARQARTAGRSVRWRYGSLLIDGQLYTGAGSMPSPKQTTQHAAPPRPRTHALPSSEEHDGWQTVRRRQPVPEQRAAPGSSRKALFAMAPLKPTAQAVSKPKQLRNAAGSSGNGKAASSSGKAASNNGTAASSDGKAASNNGMAASSDGKAAGSNGKPARGTSGKTTKTKQPAGGAGGAPAGVASAGSGKEASFASAAQPLAGHGVGPTHAKPPPAAADGSSTQPSAASADAAAAASAVATPSRTTRA